MKHRALLVLVAVLIGAPGCRSQTEGEGMRIICDVPKDCPQCIEGLDHGDTAAFQAHLREHLTNRDAAQVFEAMLESPGEGTKRLRSRAAAVGLQDCGLANYLARPITISAPPRS